MIIKNKKAEYVESDQFLNDDYVDKKFKRINKNTEKKSSRNKTKKILKFVINFSLYIILFFILEIYFKFTYTEMIVLVGSLISLYSIVGTLMLIFLTLLTYWRTKFSGFALELLLDFELFVMTFVCIFTLIFYKNDFFSLW